MVETREHKILKTAAKNQLREEGFEDIVEEYTVSIGSKCYRIDIVGFKGTDSVAIECGSCQIKKLQHLRKRFTEVRWIPYYGNKLFLKYQLLNPDRDITKLKEGNMIEKKSEIVFIERENEYAISHENRDPFACIYYNEYLEEWIFSAFDSGKYCLTAMQKITERMLYLNEHAKNGKLISFLNK